MRAKVMLCFLALVLVSACSKKNVPSSGGHDIITLWIPDAGEDFQKIKENCRPRSLDQIPYVSLNEKANGVRQFFLHNPDEQLTGKVITFVELAAGKTEGTFSADFLNQMKAADSISEAKTDEEIEKELDRLRQARVIVNFDEISEGKIVITSTIEENPLVLVKVSPEELQNIAKCAFKSTTYWMEEEDLQEEIGENCRPRALDQVEYLSLLQNTDGSRQFLVNNPEGSPGMTISAIELAPEQTTGKFTADFFEKIKAYIENQDGLTAQEREEFIKNAQNTKIDFDFTQMSAGKIKVTHILEGSDLAPDVDVFVQLSKEDLQSIANCTYKSESN